MEIGEIHFERKTEGEHCGTLSFKTGTRTGFLLFIATCQVHHRITIEFVPGLAAHQADIAEYYEQFSDAVARQLFEQVSRKSMFARRADVGLYLPPLGPSPEGWFER
ncbi:MAG: hypothetical protein VKN33_08640 [Candidatus Sericytochromatia bacterium]|nr:hypothetical protein [Candidatus Sericytochromatia bacterium]